MLIERHIPNRKPGEKLVLFLRRHWIYVAGHYLFYILLILIPIGLYYFFQATTPTFLSKETTYAALLLLASIYYLFIWLFFYNTFIDYYLDIWIVTNFRIISIEQSGLFNRQISEHYLDRVQDVTASQKGFLNTLLTYGDVHIQTAAEKQYFVFEQIDNPFDVVRIIQQLAENYKKEHPQQ